MTDQTPVQSFDLPDDCQHDHVAIYPNDAPDGPHFYAVPFDYVADGDFGKDYYQEPENFEVTKRYREAVAKRADVDISDVKLRIDVLPAEEVDPI